MPFVNTAKTKIHNFWLAISLGSPKMAAALPTKRLYPPIAALCDFDIVLRRTGHLNVSNGSWQYRSKWRARKDLAILAVACNDPGGIYNSLKRDGTTVTPTCYFHEASFQSKFLSAQSLPTGWHRCNQGVPALLPLGAQLNQCFCRLGGFLIAPRNYKIADTYLGQCGHRE